MANEIIGLAKKGTSKKGVKAVTCWLGVVAIPSPVTGVIPTPFSSFSDPDEIAAINAHPQSAVLKSALDAGTHLCARGNDFNWYDTEDQATFRARLTGDGYDKFKARQLRDYDNNYRELESVSIVGVYLNATNP